MIEDKTLTCRDCGSEFLFTVGEQEFYASKGFTNEPVRCKDCRQARRRNMDGGGSYGDSGYSTGYSGGRGGYGGQREMFPATCSDCGKATEVPFQPRNDKPVYCSECFEGRRSTSRSNRW
jgi:CxxC-x17-CxxC domain-containing protein